MKIIKNLGLVVGLITLVAGVAWAAYFWANHYLATQTNLNSEAACTQSGSLHSVVLKNDSARPQHSYVKLCDRLTIINQDAALRLIAFGPHDNHQAYDGVLERLLQPGQSLTITLNKVGTYYFHDHLADIIQGDFTVTN